MPDIEDDLNDDEDDKMIRNDLRKNIMNNTMNMMMSDMNLKDNNKDDSRCTRPPLIASNIFNLEVKERHVIKKLNDNKMKDHNNSYECEYYLDNGATISATGDLSDMDEITNKRTVHVTGCLGSVTTTVTGIGKVFGELIVYLPELKYKLVSFSQLRKMYRIDYHYHIDVFSIRSIAEGEDLFCFFEPIGGLYSTNRIFFDQYHDYNKMIRLYDKLRFDNINTMCEGISDEIYMNKHRTGFESDREYIRQFIINREGEINDNNRSELTKKIRAIQTIRNLHLGLAHPGEPSMRRMIEFINDEVEIGENSNPKRQSENMQFRISEEDLNLYFEVFHVCVGCVQSKETKDENPWRSNVEATKVGDLVHIDWVFYTVRGKKFCYMITIDEVSKYAKVMFSKKKNAKSFQICLKSLHSLYHQSGHKLKGLASDRDPSFKEKFVPEEEIYITQSNTGGHESTAEASVKQIQIMVLSLMSDLGYEAPDFLYKYAVLWACNAHNMKIGLDQKSPFERFHGRKYNINFLTLRFGDIILSRKSGLLDKLEAKADFGIIVELDLNSVDVFKFFSLSSKTFSYRSKFSEVLDKRGCYNDLESLTMTEDKDSRKSKIAKIFADEDVQNIDEEIVNGDEDTVITPDKHPDTYDGSEEIDEHLIETLIYSYYKPFVDEKGKVVRGVKWYHVKWLGYILIDNEYDLNENIIKNLFTKYELKAVPSKEIYMKSKIDKELVNSVMNSDEIKLDIKLLLLKESIMSDEEDVLMITNHKEVWGMINNTDMKRNDIISEEENEMNVFYDHNINFESMSYNQCVKSNGLKVTEKAEEEELRSLLSFKTWVAVRYKNLTEKQRRAIIPSFMFFKNKYGKDGKLLKVKARCVGSGDYQDKLGMDPNLMNSSTVRTSSYFTLLGIGVAKKREITIADVKSAYLQADLPDELIIHMRLNKKMSEALIRIDNSYRDYLTEKGEIIVQLKKALYGLVQSAKLWYNELKNTLGAIGYAPLPSSIDPNIFVRHMPADEEHDEDWMSMIGVHVDDLGIISSNRETERLLDGLTKRYGEMAVQRLNDDNDVMWLGIKIKRVTSEGAIILSQKEYIEKLIVKFTELLGEKFMNSESTQPKSPAKEDLFEYDTSGKKEEPDLEFLSVIMSIAFLASRTRPDLLTAVAFLSSRTFYYDEQDKEKMKRLIKYMIATKDKVMRLSPKNIRIHVWTDASYGNHVPNRRGQTGIVMSLDYDEVTNNATGFIYANSTKQPLVAQSTAEAELMAQAEGLKYALWMTYLLNELGFHDVAPAIIYQDNQAAIQMGQQGHGKFKNTKHIEHKYFRIFECIEEGTVTLIYCKTENMLADIHTKATQGKTLKKLSNNILNAYSEMNDDDDVDDID